jgi:hypothetical protein
MTVFRRLAHLTLFSLGFAHAAAGQPQFSIPYVPVSTVRVPRTIAPSSDTNSDILVIVRGLQVLDTERVLEQAWIGVGVPGSDVRAHPARRVVTGPDGTARIARLDRDSVEVVVLRIGYEAMRFLIGLGSQCPQTIEVYLATAAIIDGEVGGPARPRPRVVLTTCAPRG